MLTGHRNEAGFRTLTALVTEQFDVAQLARITDSFTGSVIERAFTEAMFLASGRDREPTNLDIAGVLNEFVPLSKQMVSVA